MPSKSSRTRQATSPNERREKRRAEIVDRAAEIFSANGYANTGLSEFCEVVGLGRGALYYYIESKEALLGLIHDRVMDVLLPGARAIAAEDLTPTEAIAALGQDLIRIITTYPNHVWVFLHEFRSLSGERAKRFRALRTEYEGIIESVIRRGTDTGEFRDLDPRLTTLAWLGLHNYIYIWYRNHAEYSADVIANAFAEFAFHGIRNDPATSTNGKKRRSTGGT